MLELKLIDISKNGPQLAFCLKEMVTRLIILLLIRLGFSMEYPHLAPFTNMD